jgi:hypothetical protein
MRQADYTQKTQTVAEQRKQLEDLQYLARRLEEDPHGTLGSLADAYGWNPQGQGDDAQPAWEDMDPIEQRLTQAEEFMAQQQRAAARAQIEQELESLRGQYGEFDRDEIIRYAAERRMPLTSAYRDLHFDKVREQQQRVEEKRTTQIVEGAGTTQKGAVSAPPPAAKSLRETIRDAYRASAQR